MLPRPLAESTQAFEDVYGAFVSAVLLQPFQLFLRLAVQLRPSFAYSPRQRSFSLFFVSRSLLKAPWIMTQLTHVLKDLVIKLCLPSLKSLLQVLRQFRPLLGSLESLAWDVTLAAAQQF